MIDPNPESGAEIASVGGRVFSVENGPRVTYRPRLALRLAAPVMIVLGLAAVAVSPPLGIFGLLVGAVLAVAWIPRVEIGESSVRFRGVARTITIAAADVSEIRLRRVPFGPPRPPHRSIRVGPFSSTPIRLRVIGGDEMIQLTVVAWERWPTLVRQLLTLPGIEIDPRTVGRLERYG